MEYLITLAPIIIMLGGFWLLMIMPEKKRQKKYKEMLIEIKVNDKVATNGGIIGKIIRINGDEIVLDSEGTRLRMFKNSINNKLDGKTEVK